MFRSARFDGAQASCGASLPFRFNDDSTLDRRFAAIRSILSAAFATCCLTGLGTTMSDIVPGIHTIDELRIYVRTKLCDKENLLTEQSKFREAPLIKQGQLCGFQFSVQGPRQVRLGAVWASDHNDVYFYDTRGNRFHKVHLPERIALPETSATLA
jgi:hypothetical protein